MEQEGYVSLWVGEFKSDKDLQNYLSISYNQDGDAIPSKFEKDFNIDYYDEDFREAEYFDREQNKLPILLEGCSYDNIVIPNFVETHGEILSYIVNSIILLYNFQYSEKAHKHVSHVKYIGNVKYK
ncbi:immunity 22 family protein [Bacillus infantis]|uniref:immunity 22 family protein n=1 Tax=Bacillus infantis TaxID=324767 RepID=UPI00209DC39B|nr:immunity 22 family protein [Bacillus infantis]MCP1161275.1 immunity 22 family protein [Bacillus infantis]